MTDSAKAEPVADRKLVERVWTFAIGIAFAAGAFAIQKVGVSSTSLSHIGGQFVGFSVIGGIIASVAALLVKQLKPVVLPLGISMGAIFLVLVLFAGRTGVASSGEAYLPNSYVNDWMSRSRTICLNRTSDNSACEGVAKVISITERSADIMLFMSSAAEGIKITMTMRQTFSSDGMCWTVPSFENVDVNFYLTNNNIGNIEASDQLVPMTTAQRNELLPAIFAGQGFKPGDISCSRFVVHDKNGEQVTALREVPYLNGGQLKGEEEATYHFFAADARLPLVPFS